MYCTKNVPFFFPIKTSFGSSMGYACYEIFYTYSVLSVLHFFCWVAPSLPASCPCLGSAAGGPGSHALAQGRISGVRSSKKRPRRTLLAQKGRNHKREMFDAIQVLVHPSMMRAQQHLGSVQVSGCAFG